MAILMNRKTGWIRPVLNQKQSTHPLCSSYPLSTTNLSTSIIDLMSLSILWSSIHLQQLFIFRTLLFSEILVHNSSGGSSVSFTDTLSLSVLNFTATNCHLDLNLKDSSDSTVLDVFVLYGSTLTSHSSEIFFNNLTFIDSKRLGSGNISTDWLYISDSEFSGDAFTNCLGRCYVKNDVLNIISITNNHVSYFTTDFATLIFELESSSLEISGYLDISGSILVSDDSTSNFEISETTQIINGGSLEVENYLDLTGFLSVIDGQLILPISHDFIGNLSILESGHANFSGDSYVFDEDSTFLYILIIWNCYTLTLTLLFSEILVHNSSGGSSVSFTDTLSLNVLNFTATNCHLDLNLKDPSDSTVLDEFVLHGSTLTSHSSEIFFNNLTLIDSKRLGSGNISTDWLYISDSEFSDDASTNCIGLCYVKNGVLSIISITNNHDLVLAGVSHFTTDFATLIIELESSNLEISGHLDISGSILVSDDSTSKFQISGTAQIINGGSLEVHNCLDLTGFLSVVDGQLILPISHDFIGNLSILESGHANFSGDSYVFYEDSTFLLHPNNLELLHSDPVVTIKGSFIGAEYFNHSKGEFKFLENSIFDTPIVYVSNSAFLNISDTEFKLETCFEVDSGAIELNYLNNIVPIEIPSVTLLDEILVHNSSGGSSVWFTDTLSLNVLNFTATNCHLDLNLKDPSDSTVLDEFVLHGSTLTSHSSEIFFNNLTLIDSKRLGSGNISADWLYISDSEFSGDAFTNCIGLCYVKNDVLNIISITNNHDLILAGVSYFTTDFTTLIIELESSNLEISGHLDISGSILVSDDSTSKFQISGTAQIINGGSLEVHNCLDLTGFLSVVDGQLILPISHDFIGNLSILESGHANFSGDSYVFYEDSTFLLHPNNLELLHSDPVVTIKGNSGVIELNYLNNIVPIEIPSVTLLDGELSLTGGHFSFSEILVHNSSGGSSVSFTDTLSLNVLNFTATNCHLDLNLKDPSDSTVLDEFVLHGSTLTSHSSEIFFNNLTLIDSKRLGSGNISADWLYISDSEFSDDAFTNCIGRCYVKNDVLSIISITNNHDLVLAGVSHFTTDFATLIIELESSNLVISGHLDISGSILVSDDSTSNFQISGTAQIINGASLEVHNCLDLTGLLSVVDGQLILPISHDFIGNLSILESGHANFSGDSYVFYEDSTFLLHPNYLELLHSDPVVTIKGSFIGVEYFNHSKGEFKFVENSIFDTPIVYVSNSTFLNFSDTEFKLETSFEVDSGVIELNYLNNVVPIEIPSVTLLDEILGHNSSGASSVSFTDTLSLNVLNFTATNCHLDLNLKDPSDSTVLDEFVLHGSTLTSHSSEIFFNNLTLIDSKRLGSGNISADWLYISDSEFSDDAFTNCIGRCYVKNDVLSIISITNNHDLVLAGVSHFTTDFATLIIELESSNLVISGHLDISGSILVSDDSTSNFQISGTAQIINGGSLEVHNCLDLTGLLSVVDGQLILPISHDFIGNLSILESGHANFSGDSYVFYEDSTFLLHPNYLELLHSDPVVTIKGSFIGVEYFNHSKGEFKFVENSIFDTPIVYVSNSTFLNFSDTEFKLETSFEVDSGVIELNYLNNVVPIEIPSVTLLDGELSLTGGHFFFQKFLVIILLVQVQYRFQIHCR
ncbi:hypothetical protein GEMRC1_001810 [Eukaryota sp. GEM-RC1]